MGVDGIECDIRETCDHNFIVFHDEVLMGKRVTDMQLAEIKLVRLQGKFQTPTLDEVATLCRNRVKLLLDVKELSSFEEFVLLATLNTHNDDLLVDSFDSILISKIAQLSCNINLGLIADFPLVEPVKELQTAYASFLVMKCSALTTELVSAVNHVGYEVFVWNA